MSSPDRVSVIVPAFNAEVTLAETLMSIRRQTHANLEIVVVDDGSTDGTGSIVRQHVAEDARVRLVTIENGGVARARNVGISASRGNLIAPVDADDLWHPEKIARQVAAMHGGGRKLGYVYTFWRFIDAQSCILGGFGERIEGHVYLRSILHNFVGNGSSLLLRRKALEEVGGYQTDLHRRDAQGCEDYLLQVLIARRWEVGCVPLYLTGYRWTQSGMSKDWERMARSHRVMLEHIAQHHPETPTNVLAASEAVARANLAVRRLHRLQPVGAAAELWRAARVNPIVGARTAWLAGLRTGRGIISRRVAKLRGFGGADRQHFLEGDPAGSLHRPLPPILARKLEALALQESAFFQAGRQISRDGAAGPGAPEPQSPSEKMLSLWNHL